MSTTLKSLKEAMSARLRLAAALAREEQKRKDKDAARAAREAQQKAQQPKPPVKEAKEHDMVSIPGDKSEQKHRVSVTVSDPQHTMASKRGEKIEKRVKLYANDREHALTMAKHHFKRQGYKVHDAQHIGMTEEADMDKTITFKSFRASLQEKKLTPAEMKKREEVAKAIERENPKMPMGMKMAIATKTAKRVAEQAYTGKGNHRPGWMLKADPELAKKFKEKQDLHKAKVKAYGNPAAGKSIKEELGLDESVKTTHENPLVTVHDKDGLHTHANLSTANSIFNTNVKHTDVHKGPVHVTSGREDKNKLKFAISKHHAQAVKDEEKFKKEYGESVEDQHLCAKHVRSSLLGDGVVLEAQHAEPDEEGNIEWYMVEFKSGISKVYTEDLEIMIAEYHGNHKKKKRMTNG